MKFQIAIIALALAGTVHAQVYKCRDSAGNTVYQSNRCELAADPANRAATGPVQQPIRLADAKPSRQAEALRLQNVEPETKLETINVQRAYFTGPLASRNAPRYYAADACTAAKSRREEAFEKLGPQRSASATRFYDEAVERACN